MRQHELTLPQYYVLMRRIEGQTLKSIAMRMQRSIWTVAEHEKRARRKLGGKTLAKVRREDWGTLISEYADYARHWAAKDVPKDVPKVGRNRS